jgi:hypothetical protein
MVDGLQWKDMCVSLRTSFVDTALVLKRRNKGEVSVPFLSVKKQVAFLSSVFWEEWYRPIKIVESVIRGRNIVISLTLLFDPPETARDQRSNIDANVAVATAEMTFLNTERLRKVAYGMGQ